MAAIILATGAIGSPGQAHESRPAYLEISEDRPGQYKIMWKLPRRGHAVPAITPRIAPACGEILGRATYAFGGSVTQQWTVDCGDKGIAGRRIHLEGADAKTTDVLVRVNHAGGPSETKLLRPDEGAFMVKGATGNIEIMAEYLFLGVKHILSGIDHLLFVVGMLLIVSGVWRLVKTITAFTVAHSLTLGAAALGFVHMPQAPVEAGIALSILFLASELSRRDELESGLTARRPWLVALSFGLLHGFGFAGALAEIGLPKTAIPLALFAFNLGVEAGQLLVVTVVLTALWVIGRWRINPPRWIEAAPSYVIGSAAAYWLWDRLAGFV